MRRPALLAALLAAFPLALPLPARASADEFGPALFAFLRPGGTLVPQARKLLGEPESEYDTHVFEGMPDPLVEEDEVEHYRWQLRMETKTGKKLLDVHVLEYHDPAVYSRYAKLVFREGRLWYALVPIAPSESTPTKLQERYGHAAQKRDIDITSGDVRYTATLWDYPEAGAAYFQAGEPEFQAKLIYPVKN